VFDWLFCTHATVAKTSPQYLYFSILCYCVSFAFIKISILTQYRRIFSVDTTSRVINIVMAIVVSSGIAALFTFMLACVPIDAFWNIHKRPTAKCINADMYNRIHVFSTDHVLIPFQRQLCKRHLEHSDGPHDCCAACTGLMASAAHTPPENRSRLHPVRWLVVRLLSHQKQGLQLT
jgi:hypothetical protein